MPCHPGAAPGFQIWMEVTITEVKGEVCCFLFVCLFGFLHIKPYNKDNYDHIQRSTAFYDTCEVLRGGARC